MNEGLFIKQAEVHGMSQRGGEVQATLRISDKPIASPLIPKATAALILSFEPLEGLRYLPYLSSEGALVTSTGPVTNIGNYPALEGLLAKISALPKSKLIEAEKIAREAGSPRAANMVMVGAASHLLPLKVESLENAIRKIFGSKGDAIVETNIKAFHAGRNLTQ